MTEVYGRKGVWFIYDFDVGPYVISVEEYVLMAVKKVAKQSYGRVGFWPFGMSLSDAVAWWEEKSD